MSISSLYFDYNSGSPLRSVSRDAMDTALSGFGNPSSVHGFGRSQRSIIERSRASIADLVGSHSDSIIFTSGATEAAHLGLSGGMPSDTIYMLSTEHPCILSGGGKQIVEIPVLPSGLIDESAFDSLLSSHTGIFCLALQLANSETGVIQPVAKIASKVKSQGGVVLCDAVQAIGR